MLDWVESQVFFDPKVLHCLHVIGLPAPHSSWIGTTARFSIIDYRYPSLGELDARPTSRMQYETSPSGSSHQKTWPGSTLIIMIICTFENLFSHASAKVAKGIQRYGIERPIFKCNVLELPHIDVIEATRHCHPFFNLVQDPRPLDAKSVSEQANGIESINLQRCIDCLGKLSLQSKQCGIASWTMLDNVESWICC